MKFILGCFLAALVSFVWGYVSWMTLGWHEASMHGFKEESAVAAVIKANASHGRGIYMLPSADAPVSFASPEDKEKAVAARAKALEEGPYVYAIVRPGRSESDMMTSLLYSFGRSFLACVIIAGLLSQTVISYPGRVAFGAAAGVFAGLVSDAQMWIWFEAPNRAFMVNMADHFIEWLLVGAVLGLFVGKEPTANDFR